MKPSELKISISVESHDEKTVENYRNCYISEKRIVSKLSKISISNFNTMNWRLGGKFCYSLICIFNTFWEIRRQKASQSGRFIVSNNSASSKNGLKTLFHFFLPFFLKVLELSQCRRGDPYMTANRNFIRFADSY